MNPAAPRNPGVAGHETAAGDLVGSSAAGPAALRGSALRSGGYALTVLLSVASAPLLIRHLGVAGFGRYTTVIALVTIVGGLTDGGLLSIAMREWTTRAGEDRRGVMRSILGLRLELSLGGMAVAVAFAVIAGYDSVLVLGTLIAGVGMMLQVTVNLLTVALQGELRFGWATVIDVVRQTTAVILIVALVLAGAGLVPFFAATVPAGLTALGLTAWLVRGQMPLRWRWRGVGAWELLRDTVPYAAAIALNALYFRVTIVAMSLLAPAEQTGYFATSFRVTEVLIGVPSLAVGAAFPILSRAAREDTVRFAYATERILELALIAGAGIALVVVLAAPFAIDVLAGAAAAPASSVLQIQGLALVATFMAAASGYPLLSLHRHRALLVSNLAALVANVVLTALLVPVDQARGAAIAAVVAETCLAVGQVALLLRATAVRISVRALGAVAIAATVGACPLLIAGVHPLLRMVAGVSLYLIVLAILHGVPPELAHFARRPRTR